MLELEQVSKHYKSKLALNGFSYHFEKGIYALLGPNGAGKSTLMNIIAGILRPDANSMLKLGGKTPKELGRSYQSAIGYMPQQEALLEAFTPIRFLSYIAGLKGLGAKAAKLQTEQLLKHVELWDNRYDKIKSFSGGMKQRLLFTQALLGNPGILILDEPSAGLDPRQRVILRRLIQQYAQDRIVLISTHIVSDIEEIADEILILKSGELLQSGTLDALLAQNHADTLEQLYMMLFDSEDAS